MKISLKKARSPGTTEGGRSDWALATQQSAALRKSESNEHEAPGTRLQAGLSRDAWETQKSPETCPEAAAAASADAAAAASPPACQLALMRR
jgi:hypothetical protein